MKRIYLITMLFCLFAIGAQAQVPTRTIGDGPVWRITYFNIKPGKGAEYLIFLGQHSIPMLDEQKKQGLIVDYKYFSQPTTNGPNDWDVMSAIAFKTYGEALDYDEMRAKSFNEIGLKHYGSNEARTKANDSLNELRDVVAVRYIREQFPLPRK